MSGGIGNLLWLVEVVGTPIVLVLLVRRVMSGAGLALAVTAAVVFGLVFANPFGVAVARSREDPRPLRPSAEADDARHWLEIAGVRVAWFYVYSTEDLIAFDTGASGSVKLRYGLTFLPSTGGGTVFRQCSNDVTDPCWRGNYPLVYRDRDDTSWIVAVADEPVVDARGRVTFERAPRFYELRLGVVSWAGLVYWLLVAGILAVAAADRRVVARSAGLAAAASVAAGFAITLVVAASPPAPRPPGPELPELIPKAPALPRADRRLRLASLSDEGTAPGCVRREGTTTQRLCALAELATAAESRGGILAAWTSRPNPGQAVGLRVRRLSRAGRPVAPSTAPLAPWPGSGPARCRRPAELQATRLAGGAVLVAWWDTCVEALDRATHEVRGVVLAPSGRLRRGPFRIVAFRWPRDQSTPFRLASTAAGRPFVLWRGESRNDNSGRSDLFAAFLDGRGRARRARRLTSGPEPVGVVAVACDVRCYVAHASEGVVEMHALEPSGRHVRLAAIRQGASRLSSDLVASAVGGRLFVGWLELRAGIDVTARIATFRDGEHAVETVARGRPPAPAREPAAPEPLGLAVRSGTPTLLWQTQLRNGETARRVYSARRGRMSASAVDRALDDSTVVGSVVVAVARTVTDNRPVVFRAP
jgi:hypothetical protein